MIVYMYIPTKNIYGFSYMFWFLSCGLKEEEKMSKTPYHARYHAHPYNYTVLRATPRIFVRQVASVQHGVQHISSFFLEGRVECQIPNEYTSQCPQYSCDG